jgi:hypothetical protein
MTDNPIRNTTADMNAPDGVDRLLLTAVQLVRFREKIGPRDPATGCEEWTGARLKGTHQYGQIRIAGVTHYAHRISYGLNHGQLPAGKRVLHRCDNPPCTRGDHLFAGTAADNSRDMADKERWGNKPFPGSTNGFAKLDEERVRTIRALYASGRRQVELAKLFGVTQALISLIVRREAWRHVPPLTAEENARCLALAEAVEIDV